MVEIVCQRCGARDSGENLTTLKLKLKHEKGCGRKIGIIVVSSKATPVPSPKADEFHKIDVKTAEKVVTDEAKTTKEEKPKSKKYAKRKSKSDEESES